jgi:SAM-dependent methyltransferase
MTTDLELEYPICPLCNSENRSVLYTGFGPHDVVRCVDCSMFYLYPRLTETAITRFYEQDSYYEGGESGYSDTAYSDQELALRATFKKIVRNLDSRGLTGGRLLEIGCGYGYLLQEAENFFEERSGTEFSSEGVRQSSLKADHVYEGGVEAIPADASYDCIIALQVIEHVYDPFTFVTKLIEHASPGASIVLGTPDIGGMLKKVMGRRWPSFKVPEHVLYFDLKTLSHLMSTAGLIDVKVFPYPHAFPLALIASKFRIAVPRALRNLCVWVPQTSIALTGRVPK